MSANMVKYSLYLTSEQIAKMTAQTIKTGCTASEQIRRAIDAQQTKGETQ